MAEDTGENKRHVEFQEKLAEAKRLALEEELRRIENEASQRAAASLKTYRTKEEESFRVRLQEAADARRRDEEAALERERELYVTFDEEQRKRLDALKQAEEDRRRIEEEKRHREEEIARQKAAEEERQKQHEAERLKLESERRRREEDVRRLELDRQRREDEQRRIEEERIARVHQLLNDAERLFEEGQYQLALVEVAKALVNDPENQTGLQLDAKIRDLLKSDVQPEPEEPRTETPRRTPKRAHRTQLKTAPEKPSRLVPVLVTIIAVAAVALITLYLMQKKVFTHEMRLAVLPFTSEGNPDYVGAAFGGEVSAALDRISGVDVVGYPSCVQLTRMRTDAQHSIFQIGCNYALKGTIGRNGRRITFNLILVDSLGKVLWTNTYEREPSQMNRLAGEISQQIAEVVKAPAPETAPDFQPLNPPDLYMTYLAARGHLLAHTQADLDTAYTLLESMLRTNPRNPMLLNEAADVLLTSYEEGWTGSDTALDHARLYADAALEADTSSAGASYELGRVLMHNAMYTPALTAFDQAIRKDPSNSMFYIGRAKLFMRFGQFSAAKDMLQRASELDPVNPLVNRTSAYAYQIAHIDSTAFRYHEQVLAVLPDTLNYILGPMADVITINPDLRLREGHRIVTASFRQLQMVPADYSTLYCLARLRQVMGNEEAESLLKTVQHMLQVRLQTEPRNTTLMVILAKTLTRLGRFPEATELAERALLTDPVDVGVKYHVAQIFTMQMFSLKKKGVDPQKKEAALANLKKALAVSYRPDEITNADFYNMFDQQEFQALIQQPLPTRQ